MITVNDSKSFSEIAKELNAERGRGESVIRIRFGRSEYYVIIQRWPDLILVVNPQTIEVIHYIDSIPDGWSQAYALHRMLEVWIKEEAP